MEPFALDDKFASITTTPMAVLLCTASSAICTPNSLSQYVALGLGAQAGNTQDFAVERYTIGGELDPDFGTDGTLTVDFFANSNSGQCMALQADGEILLGGAAWSGTMLALIRILA